MDAPRTSTVVAAAAATTLAAIQLHQAAFVPSTANTLRQGSVTSVSGQKAFGEPASTPTSRSSVLPVAAVGLGLAGVAASRRTRANKSQSNVTRCAFEGELGVQAPVGYFDPLGLSKDGDEAVFRRRRASELKNGRIAMLACMGYIVPEWFRLPGFLSPSLGLRYEDMPNGLEALEKLPLAGGLQMFLWGGFVETVLFAQEKDRAPGDFANAGDLGVPFSSGVEDPEKRKRKLNSELANGRLAMVAITGMLFQNGYLGSTAAMWSPPGAFETELGVQAPLGYFDPLGLSKDGDADTFYRRRCSEIKHGRVSMWAAMGFIAPEYVRFPGYLSPSQDIKFTEVPSGLAAFSKVPAIGWLQIFAFCGFMELVNARQDPSNPPGMLVGNDDTFGEAGFGNLGLFRGARISDPEKKKRGLNSELANGRLAMFAIMGMLFQNGVTGTTGPEMWTPAGAFENELGVQSPTGFWDPVGFCADGDVASFRRRRETEIKHGRVSMLAAIGYIVPESYRFPGFLSPSEGLQFADMPHGLAAISKVPLAGVAQWFVFIGFIERTFFKADKSRAPGDFKNAGVFGYPDGGSMTDAKDKARRLNSELANGRLAMTAIMALFFQNGTVGSTGPDMWVPPAFVKPSLMMGATEHL